MYKKNRIVSCSVLEFLKQKNTHNNHFISQFRLQWVFYLLLYFNKFRLVRGNFKIAVVVFIKEDTFCFSFQWNLFGLSAYVQVKIVIFIYRSEEHTSELQ